MNKFIIIVSIFVVIIIQQLKYNLNKLPLSTFNHNNNNQYNHLNISPLLLQIIHSNDFYIDIDKRNLRNTFGSSFEIHDLRSKKLLYNDSRRTHVAMIE